MTIDIFNQYWMAIRVIESREMISQFTVADFPHLKSAQRKKNYNQVKGCLSQESKNANSTEEIARMLGAING